VTVAPETDLSDPLQAARRCSRSVQTTIGWIFWDPGAVERLAAIGLPHPFGYLAARAAPLAPAGPDAVIAAFGSIAPIGVQIAFELVAQHGTTFEAAWAARDAAVLEGLAEHAPGILEPLARLRPELWPVVEALPTVGRPLFASHLRMARPEDPVLSGWHAVNCLREWRGDTHWAVVVAAGLTGVEASVLHNAWLGYEDGWLPKSRGSGDADITDALATLEGKGLATRGAVNDAGVALRQRIEDDTDRLTSLPWELLGPDGCRRFAEELEPPCELLLRRVDETAGPNYQPGSRIR
jgi:hypothetical protein